MFLSRTSTIRRRLIVYTLIISSLYIGATVVNKFYVNSVFKKSLAESGIEFNRFKSTPLPLTNFLWMGIAEVDDGYYMALYSVFDDEKPDSFAYLKRNNQLLEPFSDDKSLQKLLKFTKGYYIVGEDANGIYIADLRFGKAGIGDNADYVFKFRISDSNGGLHITESQESRKIESGMFSAYLDRILGRVTN